MFLPEITQKLHSVFKVLAVLGLSALATTEAFALPSFARQTGEACDACHVGSFGPQLTAHGMKFKMGGYTESDGKAGHIPLAAMLIETYTHTAEDQVPAPDHFSKNDNAAMQELSLFLAGKIVDHVGAFVQVTHSGVERLTALDNTDVRFATDSTLLGQEGTFGISLNNNPTIQDPFNTLPAWRYPYTSSDLAPGPSAAPMLDDGIAGQVFGLTAYASLANGLYAEVGGYKSMSEKFLNDVANVGAEVEVDGLAPYYRLAYFKDMKSESFSVGLVGMQVKARDFEHTVPKETFKDIGVDAHYQFLGNRKNIWSVNASYIRETGPEDINQMNVAGSYYYDRSYGATVRYFSTAVSGGDSNGWTMQADWTPFGKENSWNAPWANVRLGLQYTMYNKLDGDSSNASDANTTMAFVWASL